jgi:hypothetical protein
MICLWAKRSGSSVFTCLGLPPSCDASRLIRFGLGGALDDDEAGRPRPLAMDNPNGEEAFNGAACGPQVARATRSFQSGGDFNGTSSLGPQNGKGLKGWRKGTAW